MLKLHVQRYTLQLPCTLSGEQKLRQLKKMKASHSCRARIGWQKKSDEASYPSHVTRLFVMQLKEICCRE